NDRKLFNLKLTGLNYNLMGDTYILDLGINQMPIASEQVKNGVYYRGRIADQGDLSTYFGYKHKNVEGYTMVPGKIYPQIFNNLEELKPINFPSLLKQGYAYVKVLNVPKGKSFVYFPIQIVTDVFKVPEKLNVGNNPTFFLEKDGEIRAAVINGFYTDLKNPEKDVKNGLILK
ncbi:MAG TPA: peptidase M14, partial [Salinimicrobium sp.]|nr:peptidase M14 [Salinimicrobium sp.]